MTSHANLTNTDLYAAFFQLRAMTGIQCHLINHGDAADFGSDWAIPYVHLLGDILRGRIISNGLEMAGPSVGTEPLALACPRDDYGNLIRSREET